LSVEVEEFRDRVEYLFHVKQVGLEFSVQSSGRGLCSTWNWLVQGSAFKVQGEGFVPHGTGLTQFSYPEP
jgi:hypothetical protein